MLNMLDKLFLRKKIVKYTNNFARSLESEFDHTKFNNEDEYIIYVVKIIINKLNELKYIESQFVFMENLYEDYNFKSDIAKYNLDIEDKRELVTLWVEELKNNSSKPYRMAKLMDNLNF